MVLRYYQILNYSQVDREDGTKRQRVEFWVKRFEEERKEINSIRFGQAILEDLKRFGIHSFKITFETGPILATSDQNS